MRGPDVEAYCLRCECKYEERSSVTIKVKKNPSLLLLEYFSMVWRQERKFWTSEFCFHYLNYCSSPPFPFTLFSHLCMTRFHILPSFAVGEIRSTSVLSRKHSDSDVSGGEHPPGERGGGGLLRAA